MSRERHADVLRREIEKRLWKAEGRWLVAPREDSEGWVGESRFNVGALNAGTIADAHNAALAVLGLTALADAVPKTTGYEAP